MLRTLKPIILLIAVLTVIQQNANAQNKIVGGTATTIAQVPYLVYLLRSGNFQCGGSLIRPRFVVTAAHCTYGTSGQQFLVVGGATYLSQTGVRRRVNKLIYHPKWNYDTRNFDIVVLKLRAQMTGTNIRPIALCTTNGQVGSQLRISGWGSIAENGNTSNRVRTVMLPLIQKSTCQNRYSGQEQLTASQFCTLQPGKDSCQGDSGGPAVLNGRLCGVVSWGYGCGRAQYPGVYTSIVATRAFITNALLK